MQSSSTSPHARKEQNRRTETSQPAPRHSDTRPLGLTNLPASRTPTRNSSSCQGSRADTQPCPHQNAHTQPSDKVSCWRSHSLLATFGLSLLSSVPKPTCRAGLGTPHRPRSNGINSALLRESGPAAPDLVHPPTTIKWHQ